MNTALTFALSASMLLFFAPASVAIPDEASQVITQRTSLSNAELTLQDLPNGFMEFSSRQLEQLEPLIKQYIAQRGMQVESLSIFVKPWKAQVVLSATMTLNERLQQEDLSFDQVEFQEIVQQLLKQTQLFDQLNILESRALPGVNSIGENSGGFSMIGRMRGATAQVDVVMFRRNGVLAFTSVAYPNGNTAPVPVEILARQLDERIVQSFR
jgi:hypothetical protein